MKTRARMNILLEHVSVRATAQERAALGGSPFRRFSRVIFVVDVEKYITSDERFTRRVVGTVFAVTTSRVPRTPTPTQNLCVTNML